MGSMENRDEGIELGRRAHRLVAPSARGHETTWMCIGLAPWRWMPGSVWAEIQVGVQLTAVAGARSSAAAEVVGIHDCLVWGGYSR